MAFALLGLSAPVHRAYSAPNVIVILADDLGRGDLGCYGQKVIQTPRLDQMAREGMLFTQHYSGSAVCAPSRAVLMTGRHTGHVSVRGNRQAPDGVGQLPLDPNEPTMAEVLQSAGYRTGLIGKWGLGNEGTAGDPLRRGFDSYYGYLDQVLAHNYFPEYLLRDGKKEYLRNEVRYLDATAWHKGLGSYSTGKIDYSHDLFVQEATTFLRNTSAARPFFLYLALTIPHDNGEAPVGERMEVPDLGPYADQPWDAEAKAYAAKITRMDRDVGRLLDLLKELKLDRNTLVLFTSDNGPLPGDRSHSRQFKSAGGLRGYKRDLYEGGIRAPLIAWWPGTVAAGRVSDHISAAWDILPTACELAGTKPPEGIDGLSFAPELTGRTQPAHEFLYWEFPAETAGRGNGFQVAVRSGKWKAIRTRLEVNPDAPVALYDLDSDPGETRDLAAAHPEVVARLAAWMRQSHRPAPHFPSP